MISSTEFIDILMTVFFSRLEEKQMLAF